MGKFMVTGGAGFIGSNFIPYFLDAHPDIFIVNLDKLTYASNLSNLSEVEGHPRYSFVKGDINNIDLVKNILSNHDIKGIIHFAAESHVDNSIICPDEFVRTNINGTFTLLDAARRYWMSAPFTPKSGYENCRFLHISTDEVFGTLGSNGFFNESSPYAPNSPYSASKAAADMLVRSYVHTYGFPAVITNCSNNFGPKQHDEKFIPVVIRKALRGEPIPIYGTGGNVRDWLYVMDHCTAIDSVFHNGRTGESYNIGSRNEIVNLDLSKLICRILDELKPRVDGNKYDIQISFVSDRPGHDLRYAIDPTKVETELDWRPGHSFENALSETVGWYLKKYE